MKTTGAATAKTVDRKTIAALRAEVKSLTAQRDTMRKQRDKVQTSFEWLRRNVREAAGIPEDEEYTSTIAAVAKLRSEVQSLTVQRDALKEQNRRLGFSEDLWRQRVIEAGGSVERDYEAEEAKQ